MFTKFLERLRTTPDGDGSMLDHSVFLYGSGMGDGDLHAPDHLPLVVIGGRDLIKGNRHIAAPERITNANLLLSITDRFGLELEKFGVSTGRIDL